jgi:bifunctional DNase/RNase
MEVDKVEVDELDLDMSTMVLTSNGRSLEMYISHDQGLSIENGLLGLKGRRPTTHDLQASLLTGSGVSVLAVTVDSLINGYYTATVYVKNGFITRGVDCRPSDCVALALRVKSPIYVRDELFSTDVRLPEEIIAA